MKHLRNIVTGPVTLLKQFLSLIFEVNVPPAQFQRKKSFSLVWWFCSSKVLKMLFEQEALRNLLQDNEKPFSKLCLSWGKMLVVHNHPLVVIPSWHTHTHNLKTQLYPGQCSLIDWLSMMLPDGITVYKYTSVGLLLFSLSYTAKCGHKPSLWRKIFNLARQTLRNDIPGNP